MKKKMFTVLLATAVLFAGCSIVKSLVNLSRLQFKLQSVSSVSIAGVDVTSKKSFSDLNVFDAAKITESFFRGSLPLTFTLNLAALNPNDGTGGYARTDAQLKSLPFRLVVGDHEILQGNIAQPVTIPGTGEVTTIPINLTVDLAKVLKDQGYESLVGLAMDVAGVGSGNSKVQLYTRPVVSSMLGDITYPEEIKVVDFSFSK